jgi:hypothetical protein
MIRACVLQYNKNWDKCLALAEFSYNHSYQTSLKMAGERKIFGPDLVIEEEEKVKTIQNNLKAAQSR